MSSNLAVTTNSINPPAAPNPTAAQYAPNIPPSEFQRFMEGLENRVTATLEQKVHVLREHQGQINRGRTQEDNDVFREKIQRLCCASQDASDNIQSNTSSIQELEQQLHRLQDSFACLSNELFHYNQEALKARVQVAELESQFSKHTASFKSLEMTVRELKTTVRQLETLKGAKSE